MASNGPQDDFDHQQAPQFENPDFLDSFDEEAEPTPWYRKPLWLIGWALLVIILIALIVYGICELIRGGGGTGNTPATTTVTTSTTTTTTTPPSSATTTTAPPPPPQTSSPAQPEPTQQPTHQPAQQPTHRHHLPQLPSVITIPGIPTPITLPPDLP
jgi:hypothetical protein